MNVDTNALLAALKMSGQDVAQAQRTLAALQTMRTLRENPSPDAMSVVSLLAQINPKYHAMAALARALQASDAPIAKEEKPTESEPFVQRNHFEE